MEMPRLSKTVRKIVKLERDEDGSLVPTVLYKASQGKRKVSSALGPLEKGIRKLAKSQATMADSYLAKHNRSNEKRRDGWIRDLASNVTTAERKGRKKLIKNAKAFTMPRFN